MKPKPFSALNHFTVPVAILVSFCQGLVPGLARYGPCVAGMITLVTKGPAKARTPVIAITGGQNLGNHALQLI
jgi:hypothetical protein